MRTIFIDFDGTIVEHKFPDIGKPNPHAIDVIKKLHAKGHELVLNTTRADIGGKVLEDALQYTKSQGYNFDTYWSTNKRRPIIPWSMSMRSKNGSIFIDDETKGIPLIKTSDEKGYMVDWIEIEKILINNGILKNGSNTKNTNEVLLHLQEAKSNGIWITDRQK